MIIDIFNRRENKNFKMENVFDEKVEINEDLLSENWDTMEDLQIMLETAWADKSVYAGQGSDRAGIFEIQTDKGIFSQVNEKRLRPNKPGKIIYKTWEQLEAEEAA